MSNDANTENTSYVFTPLDRANENLMQVEGLITTAFITLEYMADEFLALLPGELTERQMIAADALDGLKATLLVCDNKVASARTSIADSQQRR